MKTAFIFPAFVNEYLGSEPEILEELAAGFPRYLKETAKITGDIYEQFSPGDPAFIQNELRNQVISYVFSCCLADTLISRNLIPDFLAGYSMGLYAALYTGRAINFESGIRLIEQAFQLSRKATDGINAGMGSVIGLTEEEIEMIIGKYTLEAEIANRNSRHAHLVTGRKEDLDRLLGLATEEGALHVSSLTVSTPYHSKLLAGTQEEFRQYISENMTIQKSRYPVISSIDQRPFISPEETALELTANLFQKLDWQATFETILKAGVRQFVECGAGKSLHNISRFVAGDFKVYPINKIKVLISEQPM